jgi:calcium permeable stress-gated cation channel
MSLISVIVLILQATFFITYVLTSGWVGLCSEIMQIFSLIYTFARRYIFQLDDDPQLVPTFPYHTEVPKVLLFGLLGFTCSILAPLILPFLLVYFCLGYFVYRNQVTIFQRIINVKSFSLQIELEKWVQTCTFS